MSAGDETGRSRSRALLSRRRFLAAFMTLAAWLHFTRRAAAKPEAGDGTVLAGRWLLKRSDLR